MKNLYLLLFWGVSLMAASCEPLCERNDRIDGPAYYATYVYKFKEGMDYSNNVMVMGWNDTFLYCQGYRPIPLHNGYYLDGPIPKMDGSTHTIYYLDFTYLDLDNGNVPTDWRKKWKEHIIPCWDNYNIYSPFECARSLGYSWCGDIPYEVLYNENIVLETPIVVDIHIDTNILNRWIDEGTIEQYFMYGL